jgi:putative permease
LNILRLWFQRQLSDPQRVVLIVLLATGLAVVLLFGRMLVPVFASVIIAYLLEGVVRLLGRLGMPRLPAVLLVFFLFMALLVFSLFGLLPLLLRQLTQFLQQLPDMIGAAQQALLQLPERYPRFISAEHVEEIVFGLRAEIGRLAQLLLPLSISSLLTLITIGVYLVLMPLLIFFFLKDKDFLLSWFSSYLPEPRQLTVGVWHEVDRQIGNYIRGKCLEILIVWPITSLAFLVLELPYAMLLGLLTGLSVLVPYVGAAVVTLPVASVAYLQWGFGQEFIYVLATYALLQTLDGNLLAPLLFSGVVHIHPVAIIIAILVFGGLWGFWGIFFAVPLAAVVQAVLHAWPRGKNAPPEQDAVVSSSLD